MNNKLDNYYRIKGIDICLNSSLNLEPDLPDLGTEKMKNSTHLAGSHGCPGKLGESNQLPLPNDSVSWCFRGCLICPPLFFNFLIKISMEKLLFLSRSLSLLSSMNLV